LFLKQNQHKAENCRPADHVGRFFCYLKYTSAAVIGWRCQGREKYFFTFYGEICRPADTEGNLRRIEARWKFVLDGFF
jgi:hypothetical protein